LSYIKTINFQEAGGKLKRLYEKVKGPDNHIDNVLAVHSLRPHTLEGHMALYKSVLHHSSNTLPKWYLETIGTYISLINDCEYCAVHHSVGVKKNVESEEHYELIITAIENQDFESVFPEQLVVGIEYAVKLTLDHANIGQEDIDNLKDVGFSEAEILEINQVSCYFNYVNRMVVGLGVQLEEDNIGLSPGSEEENNWSHN